MNKTYKIMSILLALSFILTGAILVNAASEAKIYIDEVAVADTVSYELGHDSNSINLLFNGSYSTSDGEISSYNWTVNDIQNSTDATFTGLFTEGVYNISLNVIDNESNSASTEVEVTILSFSPENTIGIEGISDLGDLNVPSNNNDTFTVRSLYDSPEEIFMTFELNEDDWYMDTEFLLNLTNYTFSDYNESIQINLNTIVGDEQYIANDFSGTLYVKNSTGSILASKELTFDMVSEIFDVSISDIEPDNDNLEPGETITIEVEVENLDNDMDLEDVEIRVTLESIEDGSDISLTADKFDLDHADSEKEDLEFSIPYNVDEGDYTISIRVKGEDEEDSSNDFKFYYLFKDKIEVTKDEDDQITIMPFDITPIDPSCGSHITIDLTTVNTGNNDQDDIYLKLIVEELDIMLLSEPFELDSDKYDDRERNEIFTFTIPSNATEGTYNLKIYTYDDDDNLIGYKSKSFDVTGNCADTTDDTTDDTDDDTSDDTSDDNPSSWTSTTGWAFLPTDLASSDVFATIFWILGDIVLIIVAVHFVRKIIKG
ncbi:hypothetical protein HOD61_00295 [archaeon]|jgi:hypothetical protein|nr:hypothetical protein [archaeon]